MNLLDREPRVIDGVSVFLDHARDDLVWYLPAGWELARRGADEAPQFTLITYRPAGRRRPASRAAASSPWRWC